MSTPDTLNAVPDANSSFLTDLQTFLKEEDAERYGEQFTSFVVSGGVITAGAGLTKSPSALIAYPGGWRITESGAITFQDSETTYVIANKDTTGNAGTYTRVAGTHYLTDAASGSEPTLPANSVRISTVTTAGGAVTVVTDRRPLFAVGRTLGGLGIDVSGATNGQLLIGSTGANFVLAVLTVGDEINLTNAAGAITLRSPAVDSAHHWLGA